MCEDLFFVFFIGMKGYFMMMIIIPCEYSQSKNYIMLAHIRD